MQRYEVIKTLIRGNDYNVIAEVGVRDGETSRYLLETCFIAQYFLIDPAINEQFYYDMYDKNVSFMKMKSQLASMFIKDGTLDLVFIDGDHSYDSVLNDIQCWLPKLHRGGTICGHDYKNPAHRGVEKAVQEIFSNNAIREHDAYMFSVKI